MYVVFPYGFWKFNGHTEWKAYLSFVAKKLVRGWLLLALMILKNSQYCSPKYILKAKLKFKFNAFSLAFMYVCMYVHIFCFFIFLLTRTTEKHSNAISNFDEATCLHEIPNHFRSNFKIITIATSKCYTNS